MTVENKNSFISLNIGVITVSDTRNKTNDKSGDVLSQAINDAKHCLIDRRIIPDEIKEIQGIIKEWVSTNNFDAIITTGGTGLTGRDVTPDAIMPLLEKEISGFSALFHQISSSKIGTSTIQSRAFGGFIIMYSYFACQDPQMHARMHGMKFLFINLILIISHATLLRLCQGSLKNNV